MQLLEIRIRHGERGTNRDPSLAQGRGRLTPPPTLWAHGE